MIAPSPIGRHPFVFESSPESPWIRAMNEETPEYLAEPTRKWFEEVCSDYELESHHTRLLEMACQAWDEFQAARAAVAEHGLTIVDRYGQRRESPEVGIARQAKTQFCRLIRELALDVAPPPEAARPPRHGGQKH